MGAAGHPYGCAEGYGEQYNLGPASHGPPHGPSLESLAPVPTPEETALLSEEIVTIPAKSDLPPPSRVFHFIVNLCSHADSESWIPRGYSINGAPRANPVVPP